MMSDQSKRLIETHFPFSLFMLVTSGTQFDDCKCTGDNKECIKIETHEDGKLKKTDLRCQCTKGWSGSDCKTEEVNECLKPEICDRRTSICLARLKDSYVCYCKEGFVEHVKSRICKDINECANPDHNPCSMNGPNEICINTFGSYKCQCKEGQYIVQHLYLTIIP